MKAAGCGLPLGSCARRSVSFAPLKTLQVDFVKVDGFIVRNLLKSPVAHTKLKAVLRMGGRFFQPDRRGGQGKRERRATALSYA